MNLSKEAMNRLLTLCGALRDEIITPEEFAELDQILCQYPEAQGLYLDYVYLCTDLCNLQAASSCGQAPALEAVDDKCCDSSGSPLTLEMLKALGDYEKRAETVELPPLEIPKRGRIEKVSIEKTPRRISRLSLVTAIASLAALVFVLVYVQMDHSSSYRVATLSGAVSASWSYGEPPQKGLRLSASSDMIHLQQGVLEIESDKGVHILLEAPCGFSFSGPDELRLDYGKVYARVSKTGTGFGIQTRNSKIIDLGTEFGVYSDLRGETELHVFKGKTILITGSASNPKKTVEVSAGKAMRIDSADCQATDIGLADRLFVQQVDPALGLYWRGEKVLNLADVVGGGNGMETGQKGSGINPSSRNRGTVGEKRYRGSENTYNPVPNNPYVDGVFVPNGSTPQIVSSAGHVFEECPVTSGTLYSDIMYNDPWGIYASHSDLMPDKPNPAGPAKPTDPLIFIHANAGITFDLDPFRRQMPGIRLARFQSMLGMMKSMRDKPLPNQADFWVLVDGQVRHHETLAPDESAPVEIELGPTDRFLTLITTGGETLAEDDRRGIGHDLCVFINPVLTLE